MHGRSTTKATHLGDEQKSTEEQRSLYICVELEKTYDWVPRDIIWWMLERKGAAKWYIDVIKDIYDGAVSTIK